MSLLIRDAGEDDLPAILAIHNHAVLHTTAIWSSKPVDLDNRRTVIAERRAKGHPYVVADLDGAVAGYASYGDFRPFEGYARTVEHLIYVDAAFQRRGVASQLLQRLVELAAAAGKHAMVGGIAADNEPSLALHRRHGFAEVGRLPEVGFKFGGYLDLVFMQKLLEP